MLTNMESHLQGMIDKAVAVDLESYEPGRRWVRKVKPLLGDFIECPATWPHEVYITHRIHSWTPEAQKVVVQDSAGGPEVTFKQHEFTMFYERQIRTRHERLMEDDVLEFHSTNAKVE